MPFRILAMQRLGYKLKLRQTAYAKAIIALYRLNTAFYRLYRAIRFSYSTSLNREFTLLILGICDALVFDIRQMSR